MPGRDSPPDDGGGSDDDQTDGTGDVVVIPNADGTTDADALWAIRTEARDSLEMTAEAIESKDDKALATVRINVVLVGLISTAVSSFPSALQLPDWAALLGLGSLAVPTGLGILTYSGTDYPPGVGPEYLADARRASYSAGEWLAWMSVQYEGWTTEAMAAHRTEAVLLRWTHTAQAVGVLVLAAGLSGGFVGFDLLALVESRFGV
jgi:hypothetical protein